MTQPNYVRKVLVASMTVMALAAATTAVTAQADPAMDGTSDQSTQTYYPPTYGPPLVTVPNQNAGYDDESTRYREQSQRSSPQFGSGVNNDTNNTGAQVPGGEAGSTSLEDSHVNSPAWYDSSGARWQTRRQ